MRSRAEHVRACATLFAFQFLNLPFNPPIKTLTTQAYQSSRSRSVRPSVSFSHSGVQPGSQANDKHDTQQRRPYGDNTLHPQQPLSFHIHDIVAMVLEASILVYATKNHLSSGNDTVLSHTWSWNARLSSSTANERARSLFVFSAARNHTQDNERLSNAFFLPFFFSGACS